MWSANHVPHQLVECHIEQALVDAIYAAPQELLASLEGFESDDTAYLRSEATRAVTPSASLISTNGRPAAWGRLR